ncbi:Gfo/Idh/MocA family protein [Rudanella paleaurantiibacter]|nr:Gfo/Idh/MocA family oxidoreductase [Rudanella paleaurantiibacter]
MSLLDKFMKGRAELAMPGPDGLISRKSFLQAAGSAVAAGVATGMVASCQTQGQSPTYPVPTSGTYKAPTGQQVPSSPPYSPPANVPAQSDTPIELEAWKSDADRQSGPVPTPLPNDERVGYALVGLGHLTLEELLPAFGACKKSKPVALVSGNPEKLQKVARQYGIKPESCYSYDTYDKLKDNPEVQVIYIVLPNSMHAEYTIRGAQAGKHILCEKPMANSSAECRAMIDACQKANRKLMIAYRIQYEPYNRYVREQLQKNEFGKPKFVDAYNCQSSANPNHWRHIKALAGGGALPDIGLYCLNTTRFILGEEPTEVFAYTASDPANPLFKEVEEVCSWQMKFPSGVIANCATHYNVHDARQYRVMTERGWYELGNAYAYEGQKLTTSRADGPIVRQENVSITPKNQFATEMDHFSDCILKDKDPYTPGQEGLQDQQIMEAIYQSAREGRPVKLPPVDQKDRFRGPEPNLT